MLINQLYDSTIEYSKSVKKTDKKKIGQFFTPPLVSEFMGSLVEFKGSNIKILDAGAGTGMLVGGLCQQILNNDFIKIIEIDLYETDENVLPYLEKNLEIIKKELTDKGKKVVFNIIQNNFILENTDIWNCKIELLNENKYDVIISNPPYKKIAKSEPESVAMESVVHGQPNLYFLFMAMAVKLLKENGELIFIVPRSFTSGAYFKRFREYFLNQTRLTHLHLFHSRSDVFDSEKVLQEAVILRAVKTKMKTNTILVSSSENMFFKESSKLVIPYQTIVDLNSENLYIMIPTTNSEIKLIETVKSWSNDLINLGFKLKTGPVVDFRALDFLKEEPENLTVPLLWANHFIENYISHPVLPCNKPQFILDTNDSKGILLKNKDYLLIKRFSSKEEKRRIQPAIYLSNKFSYTNIGIENHLNYVTKVDGEILLDELYGLFALFNSSYIDTYYRILNGSTQVNATEVNSIPLPDLTQIKLIGKKIIQIGKLDTETCDQILEGFFINNDELIKRSVG